MPSSLQVDQIQSADGNTTYLNSGTLSNVTFPAGLPYSIKVYEETADSGNTTSTGIGFGTVRSVSLDAGENVLITISGGVVYYNGGGKAYTGIQYDTTTLSTNTQGTIEYNVADTETSTTVNYNAFGYYQFFYTAGSSTTLYYRPATGGNNGRTVNWQGSPSESSIKITEIKFA